LQRKFKNNGNTEDEAYLLKMDKQINKLTSLINDLLDATKVSAGQLTFNEDFFDFNELAIEIVAEMQQTTERHAINVKLDTSVIVPGDRNRIGQVMTNMLSNAIKYSPKADNIMVTSTQDNSHIKFCVQDFGIGIPQENKVDVFDQFFRVKGLLQDRFAGLGLGLFIASEILKRHHGVISVESVEGKGSTFCFTLPINKI
jgi:two-component system CheB/CheR fusion protein